MPQDIFVPRPDAIDGDLFLETRQSAAATAALWRVLQVSRTETYAPWVVLTGEHGAGKTTIAKRFAHATQRSIACDLVREKLGKLGPEQAQRDAFARASARSWAEDMVREGGGDCPGICRPAEYLPESMIAGVLAAAQRDEPVATVEMRPQPDRDRTWLTARGWRSPGTMAHHPLRRTSMVMVDAADRLLSRSPNQQRACLDAVEDFTTRVVKHPVVPVLIGPPVLAETIARYRATQVIHVDAMPLDDAFAALVAMIVGTRDADEVATLHRQSAGLVGRLVHIARLRGLAPPYHVAERDIRRLPPRQSHSARE